MYTTRFWNNIHGGHSKTKNWKRLWEQQTVSRNSSNDINTHMDVYNVHPLCLWDITYTDCATICSNINCTINIALLFSFYKYYWPISNSGILTVNVKMRYNYIVVWHNIHNQKKSREKEMKLKYHKIKYFKLIESITIIHDHLYCNLVNSLNIKYHKTNGNGGNQEMCALCFTVDYKVIYLLIYCSGMINFNT